jgi:uncharacterized protein YfaP (DUF2135 family)
MRPTGACPKSPPARCRPADDDAAEEAAPAQQNRHSKIASAAKRSAGKDRAGSLMVRMRERYDETQQEGDAEGAMGKPRRFYAGGSISKDFEWRGDSRARAQWVSCCLTSRSQFFESRCDSRLDLGTRS